MQQTQICENGNLIRDKLKIENMMIYEYMNDICMNPMKSGYVKEL